MRRGTLTLLLTLAGIVVVSVGCSSSGGTSLLDDVIDSQGEVESDGITPDLSGDTVSPEQKDGAVYDGWEDGVVPDGIPEDAYPDADGISGDYLELPAQDIEGWCTEKGGFGCPCTANSQCTSGWCIESSAGSICTMTCFEECPDGFSCLQVQSVPDVVFACIEAHPRLCRPCNKNQECQGPNTGTQDLCIDMGEIGSFCGGDCSTAGLPCPTGYECKQATAVDGTKNKQCVPVSGECTCSKAAISLSLSTKCFISNEWGKCFGERVCEADGLTDCSAKEPGPEVCNGEDDNCDGVADNNLIKESCEITNQFGSCPGTILCVGGEPVCQGKEPSAEVCDGLDNNCDGQVDEEFPDSDKDGIADCIETDDDADGVPDLLDNCPTVPNPAQKNFDNDAFGDACDPDDDNDGVLDEDDCEPLNPAVYPGAPEKCNGEDDDCDSLIDEGFLDTDQDGKADCIDLDDDDDAIPDTLDNCPLDFNPDQKDTDLDKIGDECDDDDDGDGFPDSNDCDPLNKKVFPGAPEMCDCIDNNCDGNIDEGYKDTDGDGIADCCEDDTDNDGIPDVIDNCPQVPNVDQLNTDGDLLGDACDPDDDNDGYPDELDCNPKEPLAFNGAPEVCDGIDNDCDGIVDNGFPDLDGDGVANCVDMDDDGDGVADSIDVCPMVPDPLQIDTDKDGMGDACDGDDDGDGDPDITDCEPLNPLVHSKAKEICNGKDDDCDGEADEEGAGGCVLIWPDVDDDGFGADGEELCLCTISPPYKVFSGGDCDDSNDLVNPKGKEVCNGLDDNCDGIIDPGCVPSASVTSIVSAGGTASSAGYKLLHAAGVVTASGKLTAGGQYSLQVGLLPISVNKP